MSPKFPPVLSDWLPGMFPRPPLPTWLLHDLGLNPLSWITSPEYKDEYESLSREYGRWAVKRGASYVPEGNIPQLRKVAHALYTVVMPE